MNDDCECSGGELQNPTYPTIAEPEVAYTVQASPLFNGASIFVLCLRPQHFENSDGADLVDLTVFDKLGVNYADATIGDIRTISAVVPWEVKFKVSSLFAFSKRNNFGSSEWQAFGHGAYIYNWRCRSFSCRCACTSERECDRVVERCVDKANAVCGYYFGCTRKGC